MNEAEDKCLETKLPRSLGCIPSPADDRDYNLQVAKVAVRGVGRKEVLPEEYKTEGDIKILDQGKYSSCVAHALATTMTWCECKLGIKYPTDFSRGFIYANRRDDQFQGEGMIVREALKQLNHDGDCTYKEFPYNNYYSVVREKLDADREGLMTKAAPYKILSYFRCTSEKEVKEAIYEQGAVVISIPVYSSFGSNAWVSLPGRDDELEGYHAMCCVGWTKDCWIVQNSWGSFFGDKGFCYIPFDYPVTEWWGCIINESAPEEKSNIFVRLWRTIKYFFKKLFGIN